MTDRERKSRTVREGFGKKEKADILKGKSRHFKKEKADNPAENWAED